MTLIITDKAITSTGTAHTAHPCPDTLAGRPTWAVSWLPCHRLDYNAAITALTLAELLGNHQPTPGSDRYTLVEALAAELDIAVDNAIGAIGRAP